MRFSELDKPSQKAIIIAILIGIVWVSLMTSIAFNAHTSASTPAFIVEATFIQERDISVSTRRGTKGGTFKLFKVDNGDEILLGGYGKIVPGDRVNVYYHKGAIFKNVIYDYYRTIDTLQNFQSTKQI